MTRILRRLRSHEAPTPGIRSSPQHIRSSSSDLLPAPTLG